MTDITIPAVCLICGKKVKGKRSIAMHLSKSHPGWDLERYVKELVLSGVVPTCKCGCGKTVSWHKSKKTFNEYVNGHNNAFHADNQPDFTEAQIDVRNKRIKEAYSGKSGERINKKYLKK